MGMMSAITRSSRGRASSYEKTLKMSEQAMREATLEDSVKQMLESINGLIDLEERFEDIERDLIGKSPVSFDKMPSPEALGMTGFVPRLMEAALLVGAITRRMHLRVGVVEGALGKRARPVTDATAELIRAEPIDVDPAPVSVAKTKEVPVLEAADDVEDVDAAEDTDAAVEVAAASTAKSAGRNGKGGEASAATH